MTKREWKWWSLFCRMFSNDVIRICFQAGRTAMHLACSAGHANVVASLILSGADVNKPDGVRHFNIILLVLLVL